MGFVRRKVFHDLAFDGDLAGLHIRVRARSGHVMTEVGKLPAVPTIEDPWGLVPLFMDQVDSWDLEREDGSQVPLTFQEFFSYDMEMIQSVLVAYLATLVEPYPTGLSGQLQAPQPGLEGHGDVPTPNTPVLDRPPAPQPPEPVEPDEPDMDIPEPPGPDLEHLRRFVVEELVPA